MDIIKDYIYTEEMFEDIQKNFNGKAEFDNGSIFLSSNTSIEHNRIKRKILSKLDGFFQDTSCEPFDEQIEVVFRNSEEVYKYKPDIFIMCDNSTKKGESFTSVPKIIFEIVSKSTSSHDYITKLAVYQKFKVEEYNIVEQSGKIIQYSLVDDQYIISDVYKNDDVYVSSIFKDLKIGLKDIF
ncbi:Uma2 family endonuclease [Clostridium botulinum]|uniref:Uma2 family endonuclease n=1 Tax=Clostridium botulinum TaxID=1491 RepID=UPI0013F7057A|nr:Uma2 family endonuclease [Clostridium botulinum]MBN1049363.1 Uma2 family endonuclease [Clostridium botulinum]MBY6836822.1 Uma2 family endonuclease [Clostridium botulinum]NFG28249.1 Uma2 family endonuclease [Clostridium botulinum]NFG64121.1 Uma2 family endonuclease [Clostridium botulinum]NFQ25618.1 Uma2 family endonuclease [Clostridium botulinum]